MNRSSGSRLRIWIPRVGMPCGLLLGCVAVAGAAGSGSQEPAAPSSIERNEQNPAVFFQQGVEALEKKDYKSALQSFERALREDRKNPDYLNMVAYTQRKLGKLDDAFKNYAKALERREKFPQAREYLAEAHLQAALAQLEILKSYGPEGENELKMLREALQRAAESVGADGSVKGASSGGW